jgi:hypothetical protein
LLNNILNNIQHELEREDFPQDLRKNKVIYIWHALKTEPGDLVVNLKRRLDEGYAICSVYRSEKD